MGLYIWHCDNCGETTRKLLPVRPKLDICCFRSRDRIDPPLPGETVGPCGGKLSFVTNTTQSTKEVIDNGLMYKPIERDPNIEAQIRERNELAEKPEDTIV
jgi:hypothetical protein